jgi:hypothetical protein
MMQSAYLRVLEKFEVSMTASGWALIAQQMGSYHNRPSLESDLFPCLALEDFQDTDNPTVVLLEAHMSAAVRLVGHSLSEVRRVH